MSSRPSVSLPLSFSLFVADGVNEQGNHELYKYPVASYVSSALSRAYGEKWVVSNVNITQADERGEVSEVMMGNRVRKFVTERGRKVTAIAPLFDFKGALARSPP